MAGCWVSKSSTAFSWIVRISDIRSNDGGCVGLMVTVASMVYRLLLVSAFSWLSSRTDRDRSRDADARLRLSFLGPSRLYVRVLVGKRSSEVKVEAGAEARGRRLFTRAGRRQLHAQNKRPGRSSSRSSAALGPWWSPCIFVRLTYGRAVPSSVASRLAWNSAGQLGRSRGKMWELIKPVCAIDMF
jgi:hypothetical protein